MAKATRQVQRKGRSKLFADLPVITDEELAESLARGIAEFEAHLEEEGYPVFLRPNRHGRHYPGEAEAFHILQQILQHSGPYPNPVKLQAVLKPLKVLQNYEAVRNSRDSQLIVRATRAFNVTWRKLENTIGSGRINVIIRGDRPVIEPESANGKTAFALLSLSTQRRTNRLRVCKQCGWWFYARFKHQRFCPIPEKRCQWNHYHASEWRKQNRERNRKHQTEYRKRLFRKDSH